MKVLIAGATGVIGRQLVPKLIANGHEVAGTTKTNVKEPMLRKMGATPLVVDILDPEAVARAVAEFEPDVIVHEATALSSVDMRHFERSFAVTNQLRTEGADHLLAAGRAGRREALRGAELRGLAIRPLPGRSSRPRKTRSTRIPSRRCERQSRRSAISRRLSSAPIGPRASPCATAGCTDRARRSTAPVAR